MKMFLNDACWKDVAVTDVAVTDVVVTVSEFFILS